MNGLSPEIIADLRARTFRDPALFCATFLHHWFRGEIPWFHRGALAILTRRVAWLDGYADIDKIVEHFVYREDPTDDTSPLLRIFAVDVEGHVTLRIGRFTQLKWPRGFAKTTIVNAATIFLMVFGESKLSVYTSETATHAETQLKNVRSEFEGNRLLRLVFGDLKPDQRSNLAWRDDQVDLTSGAILVARGAGAQIRGMNIRGFRPDRIILDDVESRESVKSVERRKDAIKWLYNDVMPALDIDNPRSTITAIGTLLHPEALLQTLEQDPRFTTINFAARLPNGELLWPAHMPEDELAAIKDAAARIGELSGFFMEYMNLVRSDETAKFKERNFRHGPPLLEEGALHIALAWDPAIGQKADRDYAAMVVVGMSGKGRIHVLDEWGSQSASMRDQIDKFFELGKRWGAVKFGIESVAFQQVLIHLVYEEMYRRHFYFEVIPITHRKAKSERIEGILAPRYASGYIQHRIRMPLLEQQLLDYPNGKDDLPDAEAMAVALLDPFAAQAAGNVDIALDTMPPLSEMIGGSFRSSRI